MAKPIVVVGSMTSLGLSAGPLTTPGIHKYDTAGNTYQHGHRTEVTGNTQVVTCVAVDSVGNVYFGCTLTAYSDGSVNPYWQSGAYTTYKTDPNGFVLWKANHGAAVLGIAVDGSGNVYTVGDAVNGSGTVFPHSVVDGGGPTGTRTGYYNLQKYNGDGALQWSADSGFLYSHLETEEIRIPLIYSGSALYVGGRTVNNSTGWGALTKINPSDGSVIWRAAVPGLYEYFSREIVPDGSGNFYIAGGYQDGGSYDAIRKIDSSGSQTAAAAILVGTDGDKGWGFGLARKSGGDLLLLSARHKYDSSNYSYLHRYNSSLVFQETYSAVSLTILPTGLAVDTADDGIYIASSKDDTTATLYKYPASVASLSWSINTNNHSTGVSGAYAVIVAEVETPPLALRVALGVPYWVGDLSTPIPALSIPLSLATPFAMRDYAGLVALPIIYRCALDDLTLPISSFSLRASDAGLALDIVIPAVTSTMIAEIETRLGGTLSLYRGVRFADGREQLELMAGLEVDSVRHDLGASSASVTLRASGAAPGEQVKTRALSGVSYRASIAGTRRVRASVDPYLSVGDIADLGGSETLVVAEMTVSVGVDSAIMEISE